MSRLNTYTVRVEFEVQGWTARGAAEQLDARLTHLIGEVNENTAIQDHRVLPVECEDCPSCHPTAEDEYHEAVQLNRDQWVAAGGGKETPYAYNGDQWLYVFNPKRQRHGYLNLTTDIVQDGSPS